MKHFHIVVREMHRELGALCLTKEDALREKGYEEAMKHKAEIVECDKDCFRRIVRTP